MEKILEVIISPAFGAAIVGLIVLGMFLGHFRQMALIRTGLIKKHGARVWRVDYDKLRSGLWLVALGGVIAATLHFDQVSGWLAFWIFVALAGVGQVLASLLGRDRWTKGKFRRFHHHK